MYIAQIQRCIFIKSGSLIDTIRDPDHPMHNPRSRSSCDTIRNQDLAIKPFAHIPEGWQTYNLHCGSVV